MNTNLTDKVTLITGASGGMGSATARAFAGEGGRLVLHYHRNPAGARKLQRELAAGDHNCNLLIERTKTIKHGPLNLNEPGP